MNDTPRKPASDKVQGEGNYEAARQYREDVEEFVEENRDQIESKAREAAEALDGSESEALKKAEQEGRKPARD